MGRTLVTGATGFIGSHLVRALAARGDELRLLVRAASRLEHLQGVEFEVVTGDVLDRDSVRRALKGADRVFHVAGSTSMRSKDREWVRRLNVEGTRNVLEEALAAGVERAVHTSSIAAVGAAPPGGAIDESASFNVGHLGIAYVNSKHEAELEAMRLYSAGLPVVVVNPSFVFGPDDPTGTSMGLIRRFLLRRIPVYVDGAINVVDVRDVAQGMLLADERGRPGERYILAARNFTLDRLFADLGRLSGVEPPALKLPYPAALAFARAAEALPGRPPITETEVRAAAQWWAFRSTKARRELGWRPSHHEDTLERTIAWYRERGARGLARPGTGQPLAFRAAGFAVRRVEAVLDHLTP